MTPDEAISIVHSKASARTRYASQPTYIDEVLVAEIERLRAIVDDSACDPEAEANARLIAAAPALLAACKHCLMFVQNEEEHRGFKEPIGWELAAAIAAATGTGKDEAR